MEKLWLNLRSEREKETLQQIIIYQAPLFPPVDN